MTSKEIIKKILAHDHPPRIGFCFGDGNPNDFAFCNAATLLNPLYDKYAEWGDYPELKEKAGGFSGEVRQDCFGNIYGRFDQKTKGECIYGILQDGWDGLDNLTFPIINEEYDQYVKQQKFAACDKYVLATMHVAVFSSLRDCRHMDNALMDTALEPENVTRFLGKIQELALEMVRRAAANGVDGLLMYDDLGMQHALFMSPATFRELFQPVYGAIAQEAHRYGMHFFLHSCGLVYDIIGGLIEVGVDAFQFDQPELSGSETLAREFGDKAVFYCPVDIQKIMPTGDRAVIEAGALNMVNQFKKCGGSLIAMDYGNWDDLGVLPQWRQWARDIIIQNANL